MSTTLVSGRRVHVTATALVVAWLAVAVVEVSRVPTFGSFTLLDLVVRGALWAGVGFATINVVWGEGWRKGAPTAGLVVIAIVAGFNWSVLAPTAYFKTHRVLYEHSVGSPLGRDYYGESLGWLRPLTANGRASRTDTGVFYPQRLGSSGDAGGYLWSPLESPRGVDMYGNRCRHPESLGGGWYLCGMD
ncbi:MAG TPA: hypothetical protein VFQ15_01220 [Jiangellaceae bacterium]|nr:hypothetical protein [Jiangellaceae bacterium]